MDYINDVFISYKRGKINEQWLNEIFYPLFYDYLNNELDHEPKIFVDTSNLTPGVSFNDELFRNLVYSKCFVSIWSPPYFRRSDWCIKEYLTMNYQQGLYKITANSQPSTLIWPILYREIDVIPNFAKNMHYLDYSKFNVVGDPFFKSELYLEFQKKLQGDIKSIATIIKKIPPLHDDLKDENGKARIIEEINAFLSETLRPDDDAASTEPKPAISW
jgi:TIR domain